MGNLGCGGHQHLGDAPAAMRVSGKRRALLVGINYRGTQSELRGCINDVMNQKQVLIENYGFAESDILMLTEDDSKDKWPYKKAIIEGFSWLYEGAGKGDLLFFQYSGHGSQCAVGSTLADCICPLDCLDNPWPASVVLDTEIHRHFYNPLPAGCKAVAIFDCCHSGSVANLAVQRSLNPQHAPRPRYMPPPRELQPPAGAKPAAGIKKAVVSGHYDRHELWVFSGCQDDQTSADAYCDGTFQGAFTWALIKALKENAWDETYIGLLDQVKGNLKGYTQIPALTTTHTSYLNWWYAGKVPEAPPRAVPDDETKTGRKKALLVGINYRNTPNELRGCINDVTHQKVCLMKYYGFEDTDILMLTEDEVAENWPYKKRILQGFEWLLKDSVEGDTLVFHYSGHGSQMTDYSGSEPSGLSDCICPLDCDKPWPQHIILDTEIHQYVYDKLPDKVKLLCIFDCCHSGSVANLPVFRDMVPMVPEEYNGIRFFPPPQDLARPATASSSPLACMRPACTNGSIAEKKASGFRRAVQTAHGYRDHLVWVYSGCQDSQTSADAYEDGKYQGAFTWALMKALEENRYCSRHAELLRDTRELLRARYTQIPSLSTSRGEYFHRFYMAQKTRIRAPIGSSCGA